MTQEAVEAAAANDLAFTIAKILTNLSVARLQSQVLTQEKYIFGTTKDMFNRIALKCEAAMREVVTPLGPESRRIIKDEMLDPNLVLQMDGTVNMLYALPEGIRNEVEDYIQARYDIYVTNKKY